MHLKSKRLISLKPNSYRGSMKVYIDLFENGKGYKLIDLSIEELQILFSNNFTISGQIECIPVVKCQNNELLNLMRRFYEI